jgi:NitT/TauT family transport system ATP-binding protein
VPGIDLVVERKAFGPVAVLRDLSLRLPHGQVTALLGPSGCGKTTITRLIAGLDKAFEGRLTPDPDSMLIGMVFQEPRLLPWRTVEENVRLALPKGARADIAGLLSAFGLGEKQQARPDALSLGLARRVAIVRALAISPDLLILDEPFVSLDQNTATAIRELLFRQVLDGGITTLLVTHDRREALAWADRLVILGGRPTTRLATVTLSRPRESRDPAWIDAELDSIDDVAAQGTSAALHTWTAPLA